MKHFFILCIFIIIFSMSCAKEKEPSKSISPSAADKRRAGVQQNSVGGIDAMTNSKSKGRQTSEENNLQQPLYTPLKLAEDRLLEYIIRMNYTCENLPVARNHIIKTIAKYGFIKNSHASTESSYDFMNIELHIRTKMLYEALTELDELGLLKQETIQVKDQTETNVWNTIKSQREFIRISRKNQAISGIAPFAKNWDTINNSLETSENTQDHTALEKWKINDNVAWAKVHLFLKTPENPKKIIIPKYIDAFKTLANIFLELVYALIIMLPFLSMALFIFLKRKAIKGMFTKSRD